MALDRDVQSAGETEITMRAKTHLMLGAAMASLLAATGCATAEAETTAAPVETPIEVVTEPALTISMPKTLLLTGTIAANQTSDVASDGAGKVRQALVERGDSVKKGQVIAWLDATDASLAQAEATASLGVAKAQESHAALECQRAETLFKERAIARAEYDRMKSSCEVAVSSSGAAGARASRAAKSVADAAVRAPFDGIVVERYVSVGEFVMPGTPVAQIVQRDPMRLRLTVPESAALSLDESEKVTFSVAPAPDATFSATVRYVGPVLDQKSRQLSVEALVDAPDERLKPGMFATSRLAIGRHDVLAIPESSIVGTAASPRVFVVREGRLEERVVLLGATEDGRVGVLKGLSSGERVAAKPDASLVDGLAVR